MLLMTDRELTSIFATLTAEGVEQHGPFRWQIRLLRRMLNDDLPRFVDIPTGLGKTSVMALWLIALAQGVKLPRRLVYVVDRRAVVDQATRFAERLRSNMPQAMTDNLRLGDGSGRLPISTLRGRFTDNREWLEDPSKPAIVVGTIDMVGSRLLFEGYGSSSGMRPYYAGFLGVDTLFLLDEAHLCPPFEALLRQVMEHRDGQFGPAGGFDSVTPPLRWMSLSATGRGRTDFEPGAVFGLTTEDHEELVVRQRLTAGKLLKTIEFRSPNKLPECLADHAIELGVGDSPARVLVYCHSRQDAIKVKALIDKRCKRKLKSESRTTDHESELLVGGRRVYERAALDLWLDEHGFRGAASRHPNVPTFLVATSAGEVGVDLNAQHMVCDLVVLG